MQHIGQAITPTNIIPKSLNRLTTIIIEFWLMILKYIGFIPSHSVRKFFYLISGINLTWTTTIHTGAQFFKPSGITIGQDTIIGKNCFLDGRAPLSIGNHVDIASDVLIYTNQHNIHSDKFENQPGPVTIKDYVFIGPRAIILPDVTIGKGSVVAAGAVVTKNIADKQIWAGIPATKIGDRQIKNLAYRLGRPTLFQ